LTSALDGSDEWSALAALPPGKEPLGPGTGLDTVVKRRIPKTYL